MTWRRGCVVGIIGIVAICLILLGVARYVFVPRVRNAIADDVRSGVSTAVAQHLPSSDAAGGTGTTTISAQILSSELTAQAKDYGIKKVDLTIQPTGYTLILNLGSSDFTYTGEAAAENGQFVARNVKAGNDKASFFLPPAKLASALNDGINNVLGAKGLALTALKLGDGVMTFTTIPGK